MLETVGFVGGGRIVRILLAGWMRTGKTFTEVRVSDPDSNTIARLQAQFSGLMIGSGSLADVAKLPLLFLAVHPPVLEKVCRELAASLAPETVVVSLAPKVTLGRLREWLGGDFALARAIPNAGSYVGQGFNPVCFGHGVNEQQREEILDLFQALGAAPVVEESLLEAYAIVTGMGPTYFWPQLYELRAFLHEVGISDATAKVALDAMLRGTIAVMFESGLAENEVMDLIPVKPLAEIEASVRESYRTKLREFREKLRPQ